MAAQVLHEVQPGFNAIGFEETIQSLSASASLNMFDAATQQLLNSDNTFKLKLGNGFNTSAVTNGFAAGPCKGLASIEQLSFLKERGLTTIIMDKLHPTLAENAASLGIGIELTNQ